MSKARISAMPFNLPPGVQFKAINPDEFKLLKARLKPAIYVPASNALILMEKKQEFADAPSPPSP